MKARRSLLREYCQNSHMKPAYRNVCTFTTFSCELASLPGSCVGQISVRKYFCGFQVLGLKGFIPLYFVTCSTQ